MDFNIDLVKDDTMTNDFINILQSFSFFPTINTFTRVTESSRTTIDNILTNSHKASIDSGIIFSDLTDHYPIVLFTDLVKKVDDSPTKIKVKVLNEKSLQKLCAHLRTKTWESVYNCKDPNIAYNVLINEITDSMDCSIPERLIKQSAIRQKSWLIKGILKSINKKNKLYKQLVKNPSDANKETYTKYRN